MTLSELIKEIEDLIQPPNGSSCTLRDAFKDLVHRSGLSNNDLLTLQKIDINYADSDLYRKEEWWRCCLIILHKLLLVKDLMISTSSEKDKLLSVTQQQSLKAALEIFVSLGVLSHLSPGVGVDISRKLSHHKELNFQLSVQEKSFCIGFATRGIFLLMEEQTFKDILMSHHLGDILGALFQLLLFDPSNDLDLAKRRDLYKGHLIHTVQNSYQPAIIRELMILNGNKDCPKKLSRWLLATLSERLIAEGGVSATLRAILEVAGDASSPSHWKTVSTLARLVTTPHIKDRDGYYSNISPQVLRLLTSEEKQFMQIAVACIRHLEEEKPDICYKHFLNKLFKPLKEPVEENSFTECITSLYNCFAIPSSEMWCLPAKLLIPYCRHLSKLYFKVHSSACFLKVKVEDLFWVCLENIPKESFNDNFSELIFEDDESVDIFYEFGEEGGIVPVKKVGCIPPEDLCDCILELIYKRDGNGQVKTTVFYTLLNIIAEEHQDLKKRFISAKFLSSLSSDPTVHKAISSDPSSIIQFLKALLERKVDASDTDIVCLGLMVLSIILNDPQVSARRKDWKSFECLLKPLKELKDFTSCEELKMLADEIYCVIATRGVVNSSLADTNKKDGGCRLKREMKMENVTSDCDRLIKEACDPLLPVRGYALRALGRLLLTGDKQARAKKESILCLFKENLKNDDSYIYLSAIEGLASIATVFPDDVLVSLMEQFVYCKEPDLKMKTGEILLRVIRQLGEMVFVYKGELINSLLHGCRDTDPLVRASSLSNLGEVCKILTFRISAFAVEIFDCIRSIFETDPAVEARRAAVMVLTLILKGLGSDALSVFEEVLVEIYRKLRVVYQVEKDEVTRLHAQLALEELNEVTRAYLFPPRPRHLSKRIFILDPP